MKVVAVLTISVCVLVQAHLDFGRLQPPSHSVEVQPLWSKFAAYRQEAASRHVRVNSGRIVNGAVAERGQFPYQAALVVDDTTFCGGSLVSNDYLLTAGHCTSGFTNFQVFLGAQRITAGDEEGRVVVMTKQKLVHPSYNSSNLNNDLGIIKLPNRVQFSEYINLIRLPRASDKGTNFARAAVTASGWGLISDNATSITSELHFVSLSVITNAECTVVYGAETVVNSTLCCSGNDGKSTCRGDSGGPLIYLENDGNPTLIGISSFVATKGCESGNPSGYTRITEFLDWIADNSDVTIRP